MGSGPISPDAGRRQVPGAQEEWIMTWLEFQKEKLKLVIPLWSAYFRGDTAGIDQVSRRSDELWERWWKQQAEES